MFSDNVPLEDELALKRLASEKGLMLMGPDCGTALIAGTPIAFANAVPRGDIGIVSASGTGLQEVSTLIARMGGGVSHGIGVGGRDLDARIGALGMLGAIDALEADPATPHHRAHLQAARARGGEASCSSASSAARSAMSSAFWVPRAATLRDAAEAGDEQEDPAFRKPALCRSRKASWRKRLCTAAARCARKPR